MQIPLVQKNCGIADALEKYSPQGHPLKREGPTIVLQLIKTLPQLQHPLSPIIVTIINMPLSDGLIPEDTTVQDIVADPNINPNLLQAVINILSNNIMQSAQATPSSNSSPFAHQRSAIESSGNDPSQSNNSSNNQPQHLPSTLELQKLKADLEKRYRINTECIKQNLSMQHHRDLQIVRDEAQRRLDDA